MVSLYQRSLNIIKSGQSPSGAYVACPNFPTYHFCWLRDSSFIAHAMDTAGEYASAEAFFRWAGRTIQKYSVRVEDVRRRLQTGQPIGKDDVLHTRYTLEGEEVTTDNLWGNFQIDGYGTWLWALGEHVRRSGNTALVTELCEAVKITLQYMELVWKLPNYNCWEENPEYLHPYSLACVYAGFDAVDQLVKAGWINVGALDCAGLAGQVKDFILKYAVADGKIIKQIWPGVGVKPPRPMPLSGVDSSLVGFAVPYNVLPADHALVQATIQAIETDLHRPDGGVYRYKADVYYGGGEWPLLTAWLGWHYVQVGKLDKANALRAWIEAQADEDGCLVEQVSEFVLAPEHVEPWIQKWGQVAKPLLWSHAMYIILVNSLEENAGQ